MLGPWLSLKIVVIGDLQPWFENFHELSFKIPNHFNERIDSHQPLCGQLRCQKPHVSTFCSFCYMPLPKIVKLNGCFTNNAPLYVYEQAIP